MTSGHAKSPLPRHYSQENVVEVSKWKGDNTTELFYFAKDILSCYKDGRNPSACNCDTELKHNIKPKKPVLLSSCVTFDEETNLTEIGQCIYAGTKEVTYDEFLIKLMLYVIQTSTELERSVVNVKLITTLLLIRSVSSVQMASLTIGGNLCLLLFYLSLVFPSLSYS